MNLPFTAGLVRTTHFDDEMRQLADRHYSRRTVREIQAHENGNAPDEDCGKRLLTFAESLSEWCSRPETKMFVRFTRGYIRRIEREW